MTERVAIASITRVTGGRAETDQDLVAVEAPVTIELRQPARPNAIRSLGVLMRTPGDDEELTLGLLHGEGLIRRREDVLAIRLPPADPSPGGETAEIVEVDLAESVDLESAAGRALPATSACGLCGRLEVQSLDALSGTGTAIDRRRLEPRLIASLPDRLRGEQSVFAETGGLHAAGLFDPSGRCLVIREDVGRHNAVDKVVGWALVGGRVPARDLALVVSGRVAFEIVQKAALAGVPVIVAVGAPSSLAVEAARAAGITLIGFTRGERFNVYTGHERVDV